MQTETIETARRRALDRQRNSVDTRARPLTSQIARTLQRMGLAYAQRYARDLDRLGPKAVLRRVSKAGGDDEDLKRLERELGNLLHLYGVQQLDDAAGEAARSVGGRWVVDPKAITDFIRSKDVRLQRILLEIQTEVRASVRDIIADALAADTTPSAGTIARRIKNTFHGPAGFGGELRGVEDATELGILPTARYTTDGGTLYAFSPERAALIARTELVQAENTGIVEGYRAAGVGQMEWLSYNDGNSGARRHDLMRGMRAPVGGVFTNPTTGATLRYPGDPDAPISETINCRCTVVAVGR